MEDVHNFLRLDRNGRVLVTESRGGLFDCLSRHVFGVQFDDVNTIFQMFMQRDEVKTPFKNILQLLDNTGKVPVKTAGESDDAFKTRLGECYENIVNTCSDIKPYSDFLHVYVFAIATLIGRPIYILHQDETGELSWSYFPFLYSHTFDSVREKPEYNAHVYITLYFSDDDCFMVDSSRSNGIEPQSYGCIGLFQKQATAILQSDDITKRSVSQMSRRIQKSHVQDSLPDNLSFDMMNQCVTSYNGKGTKTVHNDTRTNTFTLGKHKKDKESFVRQLSKDSRLVECLYTASLVHKDGSSIWKHLKFDCGFLPEEFRKKLDELESAILNLDTRAMDFVDKSRMTSEEFSDRRKSVNKAVIGGSSVGIIGGLLGIIGLALAPVTFGASLGLTIAGASIGVAGGVIGGTARGIEGVKQNSTTKDLKAMQSAIAEDENRIVELMHDIETMINTNLDKKLDHTVEGPGINQKGFLAIGSAFRSLHGGVAVGLAVLRLGSVGAAIAASVLGPVSLVIDIGFLAEAAYNLKKGARTGAGKILEENAKAIEMKMAFMKCMLRGNIGRDKRIVTGT